MARHRAHSIEFKRQVVQEFLGGESLAEFSYRFIRRISLREMFFPARYVALRTPPMPNRVLKPAENYA